MKKTTMRFFLLFTVIASVLFFVGCDALPNLDVDDIKDVIEGVTEGVFDDTEAAKDESGETKHFLGKGYDIFSKYAQEDNVKEALLNFDAMKEANILTGAPYEKTTVQTIYGSTIDEYSKSYNAAVGVEGSYGGFSASVESSFGKAATSKSTKAFASVIGQYNKYLEKINASSVNATGLTPYMTDSFKNAIESLTIDTPEEDIIENVFKVYGTHIITGAYHGGFLNYSKSSSSSEVTDSKTFGLAVSASYESVASVGASASYDSESSSAKAANSEKANIEVQGGDSVYGSYLMDGLTKENYDQWFAGFADNSKWVLCGFTAGSAGKGLYPITELITDADVKAHVEEAFNAYAEECKIIQVEEKPTPTYKLTLDFTKDNFKCDVDDAGNTAEFYGSINLTFKAGYNESLWSITEKSAQEIAENHMSSWATLKNGKTLTIASQDLTDSFSLNVSLYEDDVTGDDKYSLNNDCQTTFTFNEIKQKIENNDNAIIINMSGNKIIMRIMVSMEQEVQS